MDKKKVITICILLVILFIIIFYVFFEHVIINGKYTGYQLKLTVRYGGHSIFGEDLGSGTKKKKFNISENDTFFEPIGGGIWQFNLSEEDIEYSYMPFDISISNYTEILKVIKLDENNVKVLSKDKIYNIKYNEEFELPSGHAVRDGISYQYTIKVTKSLL